MLGVCYLLGRGGHSNPLQYSCLENPHGQRSLASYSPWGHKQSEMTEQLSTAFIRKNKKVRSLHQCQKNKLQVDQRAQYKKKK